MSHDSAFTTLVANSDAKELMLSDLDAAIIRMDQLIAKQSRAASYGDWHMVATCREDMREALIDLEIARTTMRDYLGGRITND